MNTEGVSRSGKMESAGAYGGGKAGGAFDPQAFVQKPPVIVRSVCWVCYIFKYSNNVMSYRKNRRFFDQSDSSYTFAYFHNLIT